MRCQSEGGVVEDEGEICGESYDHDIVIDYEGPDGIQWHCIRGECGVEVWDENPLPAA